jgi:hypothetical protein
MGGLEGASNRGALDRGANPKIGQRLIVVVVETTAAGRAKISVSIAHVGFLGWFERASI